MYRLLDKMFWLKVAGVMISIKGLIDFILQVGFGFHFVK